MSYLFYAAWNPPFVILIWVSTICDWNIAKLIYKASGYKRRIYLITSLSANLGLLVYFKYSSFILENCQTLLSLFDISWRPATSSIILPVGISFYTFQTLSYTIDIYRKKMKPWNTFIDYALFVTFFPQLVAGPIVRAEKFLWQCKTPKKANDRQLGWGITMIVIGLFNKIIVADSILAPAVERIYDGGVLVRFWDAWGGTTAFAIQIFCDFSGYSLCAIGSALCLGFILPINFRFPYASIGFSDFWGRWHISLSTWLRDYLYIPLGGNRCSNIKSYRNLMATMLLGGLWHGASWNFAIWGGLHGVYIVIERGLKIIFKHSFRLNNPLIKFILAIITFTAVSIAWVFFRAKNIDTALKILQAMGGKNGFQYKHLIGVEIFLIVLLTIGLQWWFKDRNIEDIFKITPLWLRTSLVSLFLIAIFTCLSGGKDSTFIYFQF